LLGPPALAELGTQTTKVNADNVAAHNFPNNLERTALNALMSIPNPG
jgi:hypothetical protein